MARTNITRAEARTRAELVGVATYRIELDLAGVADDATFGSRTHVSFTCTAPGGETWIDLLADTVEEATLNGRPLDVAAYDGARLVLPDLAADNELVVRARCRYGTTGEGLHRSLDPADGATYVYTQFATADARRVFACFEQPDLKARFVWDVVAPQAWVVASNSPDPEPSPAGPGLARWEFGPTPPLPTYLAALCGGPFHAVRSEYAGPHGTYPLGLLVRRSMAEHLDAEEVLAITRAGLAHYEAEFAVPYPFAKYDQVLLPEFNLGAMENPGLVTFREEAAVFRSRVPDAARERRAVIILHEMAHMWFGDLVTMQWWDDLWLNESFATWAGYRVARLATPFRDALTTFALSQKAWAYRQDELPSTHPVVSDMVDLEAVYLNFDGITYAKGAAVLRQLVAFVGLEPFLAGLNAYFARHAWGSATLGDLIGQLTLATGRDLSQWERVWLELPGVTTLRPRVALDDDGRYARLVVEQLPASLPHGVERTLRPHRIAVGLYRWADLPQGPRLVRYERAEVDVPGAEAGVADLVGLPAADLVLVNDDDLTYAKVGFDPASAATARTSVSAIAEPLPRALVWGALWEQVRAAELPAQEFLALASPALMDEDHPAILASLDQWIGTALDRFLAAELRPSVAGAVSLRTRAALDAAQPGSERQLALARVHIDRAHGADHVAELRALLSGRASLPGLALDADLRWRVVTRLAALGACDAPEIEDVLSGDRTSSGQAAAARARAAIPTRAAKEAAWRSALSGRLPNTELAATVRGFRDPESPAGLLDPFREEYFARIAPIYAERSPAEAQQLARGLFPHPDPATVAAARDLLAEPGIPAGLRRVLAESRAEAERALRCRALSGAADAGWVVGE